MREDIVTAFRWQAQSSTNLGSPFHALLLDLLAERLGDPEPQATRVVQRVASWSERAVADALALRLVGGLHALVRAGRVPELARLYPPATPSAAELWPEVLKVLQTHDDFLHDFLDSPPQTNEVAIDNFTYRLLVPSAVTLKDVIDCILAEGITEGPPGPRGDAGARGPGITEVSAAAIGSSSAPTVSLEPIAGDAEGDFALSFGIPAGKKGDPGTPGSPGKRFFEATASGLMAWLFTWLRIGGRISKATWMSPARRAETISAVVLYGTITALTPAMDLNISAARFWVLPMRMVPMLSLPGLARAYASTSAVVWKGDCGPASSARSKDASEDTCLKSLTRS
jgi:hypothetical protein